MNQNTNKFEQTSEHDLGVKENIYNNNEYYQNNISREEDYNNEKLQSSFIYNDEIIGE